MLCDGDRLSISSIAYSVVLLKNAQESKQDTFLSKKRQVRDFIHIYLYIYIYLSIYIYLYK